MKDLKIWLCKPKKSDWCDNDACVVIASNEEEARMLLEQRGTFDKKQGKVSIKEIKLDKAKILLTSNVGA